MITFISCHSLFLKMVLSRLSSITWYSSENWFALSIRLTSTYSSFIYLKNTSKRLFL